MNNNNALLIIDMQQEDGFVLDNLDTVVANTATLLDTARSQRFAVGQVTAVGLIDVAGIEDRHPLTADGIEQGGGMGDHSVEVFQDEGVLLLHVDDQQRVVIVHWANLIKAKHDAPYAPCNGETRGA